MKLPQRCDTYFSNLTTQLWIPSLKTTDKTINYYIRKINLDKDVLCPKTSYFLAKIHVISQIFLFLTKIISFVEFFLRLNPSASSFWERYHLPRPLTYLWSLPKPSNTDKTHFYFWLEFEVMAEVFNGSIRCYSALLCMKSWFPWY